MSVEEDVKQLVEAELRRVVGDADHFGMIGVPFANRLVIGGVCTSSGIAAGDVANAGEVFEGSLGTPKTSTGQVNDSGASHDENLQANKWNAGMLTNRKLLLVYRRDARRQLPVGSETGIMSSSQAPLP